MIAQQPASAKMVITPAATLHHHQLTTTAAVTPKTRSSKSKSPSTNGILQRFEVQLAQETDENQPHESGCSTSQHLEIIPPPSEADPSVRCPCCRSSETQLICANCLCTNVLRIGRVKEELRRLQNSKTAVCHLIENALTNEVKFESDYHQIRRSVEELKGKIAWKKDQVGRLRQRMANMDRQSERNHKNIILLERKMVSHAERIQKTTVKIIDFRVSRAQVKQKLAETLAFVSKTLFKIYWLEKRQLFTVGEHVPAWTGQTKVHRAAYLLNKCLCLDRAKILANLNGQQQNPAALNDQQQNHHHESSSASSPIQSVHQTSSHFPAEYSLAALTFAAQFAELLAQLLDIPLPYEQLHRTLLLMLPSPSADPLAALRHAIFRLDYSCLNLCLSQGVPAEECELTEPLENLHALMMRIAKGKMMVDCSMPRLDQRLYRQICEQFAAVQPNGRVLSEFTLDNVENDWVKVHCTS